MKKKNETTTTNAAVVESAAAVSLKEDVVENEKSKAKNALKDDEEIKVISLNPNVSYYDNKTDDTYTWEEIGHIEPIPYSVLKNMWRSHKTYFRNLLLRPLDERVVSQFGLTKTYEKYEIVMDSEKYTKEHVNEICDIIKSAPNGMKYSCINKIKSMIVSGELTDVFVIRQLERQFDIDLISLL